MPRHLKCIFLLQACAYAKSLDPDAIAGEQDLDCPATPSVSLLQTELRLDGVRQVEINVHGEKSNQSAVVTNQTAVVSAVQSNTSLHRSQVESPKSLQQRISMLKQAPGVMVGLLLIFLAGVFGGAFALLAGRLAEAREKAAKAVKGDNEKDAPPEVSQTNAYNAPGSPILPPPPAQPGYGKVVFFIIGHSASASMLTISNKIAMNSFQPPVAAASSENASYMWTLVVIQFLIAAGVAWVAGAVGLANVTPLRLRTALAYFPAAGMFMITIIAGNAVMNFSNVNAFLVLRSLVPLPCTLFETWVYKDARPPLLSGLALLVTVGGAVGYGMSIGGFELQSISWAVIYLAIMPVDALLIKHSISSLDISPWGLVLYNNLLAAIPAMFFMFVFEVPGAKPFWTMAEVLMSKEARVAVAVSCVLGISISYFQLRTRFFISATAFMVLGVFNKFATVFANEILNEHAAFVPILCVVITISGAILWQMTVKSGSIRVREGNSSMEKAIVFPFALACSALMWAGYIEWRQVGGVHH